MTIRAGSRLLASWRAVRVCADLDHGLHLSADDGGADRERPHGSHHRPRHCGQPASALSPRGLLTAIVVAADRQCHQYRSRPRRDGRCLKVVLGGPLVLYVLLFAAICIALQMFLQYTRYVSVLKWLTLFLFAYVACLFMVKVPWGQALGSLVVPSVHGQGLPDDRCCRPRHHHQPLPVLLAGFTRSRGRPDGPSPADTQAGASSGRGSG